MAPPPAPEAKLPPHSESAERGALGCVLLAVQMAPKGQESAAQMEADTLLQQLRPDLFYTVAAKTIFGVLVQLRMEQRSLSLFTISQWLREKHKSEPGLIEMAMGLTDATPSTFQFPEFLRVLRDKALRRWTIQKQAMLGSMAEDESLSTERLQAVFAELNDKAGKSAMAKSPRLKMWTVDDLVAFKIPPHMRIVGDNEISLGYEGLTVVAGPGSSGKSLAVCSLALAGVVGKGEWFGRRVHRPFSTMILQAENGTIRLKDQMMSILENHPGLRAEMQKRVEFSSPPEGGLPFHESEFRRSVRQEWERKKFDVVVIDPWSHTATEDDAAAVVEKIHQIRGCFPAGDDCPCIVIVTHTKKPRPEDVRKGRALVYMVSGSVALCNTARTVYMLLPFTDDAEDQRILWATPKINNGANYAPSVWFRRFGTFFEADAETDPNDWGMEAKKEAGVESRSITPEHLVAAYEGLSVLKKSDLGRRLEKISGAAFPTAMRSVKPGKNGYLSHMVEEDKNGWLVLKKEFKP